MKDLPIELNNITMRRGILNIFKIGLNKTRNIREETAERSAVSSGHASDGRIAGRVTVTLAPLSTGSKPIPYPSP